MHDEMNDLAPALLMAVIVAIGLVAFLFRAEILATPARADSVKIDRKADKAPSQLTFNDVDDGSDPVVRRHEVVDARRDQQPLLAVRGPHR